MDSTEITPSVLQAQLKELATRLDELVKALHIEKSKDRLAEIEELSVAPDFWNDRDAAQALLKEQSRLKATVKRYDETRAECDELLEFTEITDADDAKMMQELAERVGQVDMHVRDMEFKRMLSGEFDVSNAIVSINSGAGGTEAQDWGDMLMRMYLRWCERRGFKAEIVDVLAGEEAGIKSATFTVEGDYAYGYLKAEAGIHRLVRISPFDANARRHTSFASIFVMPELPDDVDVDIKDTDLKIDTYRASGAGGQHVNKTDSAVRITHLPTKIVAQCQNERSQHKNKATAMKILRAKLYEHEMEKRQEQIDEFHSQKKEIAWGSQIRSYVMAPYQMVKDHRTKHEVGNVQGVLDGDLDAFMEKFLLLGDAPRG